MKIKTLKAKSISYGGKRKYSEVKYIVIHYTGNKGDTAKANATYFAKTNTRAAGAHFFVDKKGEVYKSINLNRIAYAVGGTKYSDQVRLGGASYYGKCNNTNSVSIELCDCTSDTNWEQTKVCRELVRYIQKKCPNAKTIIRHWDVNGKPCPAPMTGKNNKKWKRLQCFLSNAYTYKAKVTKNAYIRSSAKIVSTNKIGTIKAGEQVTIAREVGKFGRLKNKDAKGKYQYIVLSKLKEI